MESKSFFKKANFNFLCEFTFLLIFIFIILSKISVAFDTKAKAAYVFDELTDTVLLAKNPSERLPPASMSKLMTLYMVFDALKKERISLEDEFRVSKRASQKGGSKMFLKEGEIVSVENLIRGIIVQSGNDACIAIAESLSGTEEAFAHEMNLEAEKLGLQNSFFSNSTGWPDPNHYMSPYDLVFLARTIQEKFPNYYQYFSETEFTWDKIIQKNRNPLLGKGLGADGLKTGHTSEAGYGIVISAKRGNRRITFVISGLSSSKERAREAEKISDWAFRDFKAIKIIDKEEEITKIATWLGKKNYVGLNSSEDIYVLTRHGEKPNFEAKILVDSYMLAPFSAGEEAPAKLSIIGPNPNQNQNSIEVNFPLYAMETVDRGDYFTRFKAASVILVQKFLDLINID